MFLGLCLLFLIPFLIWGGDWELWLAPDRAVEFLAKAGPWAWVVGVGLLAGDLVLPLPSTAVLSALGVVYGAGLGGAVGAAGSIAGGLSGYGLCRWLGEPAARFFLGERDLVRGREFFARSGGWVVALSRWLPLLPEVVACLAGLTRMPFHKFFTALVCGTLPMAFLWSWIGAVGRSRPGVLMLVSVLGPVLLWGVASRLIHRKKEHDH